MDKDISLTRPIKKQKVIFGIRLCDLNALLRLDHLFLSEENYKEKRKNTILIGIHCKNPIDEYCFCSSMELQPYFDLFFLTLPLRKVKPTVVTIHDVTPLVFPDKYLKGLRGWLKLQVQKFSLKGVSVVITDSENSKKDIGHLFFYLCLEYLQQLLYQ